MEHDSDFLDEVLADRSAKNPEFPRLVDEAAEQRRQAKIAAYREQAQDEERLAIIKQSTRAAVDAGIW